jgi:hypothetical protein
VYVSLGSLAIISLEQFTEFLPGLVSAGHPFLWVLRLNMVGASQNAVLQEAIKAAWRSKACVVDWAPQREVLRHRAVGFINVQRRDLRMAPAAGEGEHELEHRGRLGGRGVVER